MLVRFLVFYIILPYTCSFVLKADLVYNYYSIILKTFCPFALVNMQRAKGQK